MKAHDARVGFLPRHGTPEAMYGLVKQTFVGGRLVEAEPLTTDLLRPDGPSRLELGSDCWVDRPWTDVIIEGSVYAIAPVQRMTASVTVGRHCKRVEVFGRRRVVWSGGRPQFTAPEPFTTMELGWERAYGGADLRASVAAYPRNPFGRGYLLDSEPIDGVELPNFEDPDDLLTPERLIVDVEHWWMQPVPATLGYTPANVFQRATLVGARAAFPPPDDARLAEVRRGVLPAGFLEMEQAHPGFWQEAPAGQAFADLQPGTLIIARGLHPQGKAVHFTVPAPPVLDLELEGRRQRAVPKLDKLVLRPAQERLIATWSVRSETMHRTFLPGIHARIPLALHIQGGPKIDYETPSTLRQRMAH